MSGQSDSDLQSSEESWAEQVHTSLPHLAGEGVSRRMAMVQLPPGTVQWLKSTACLSPSHEPVGFPQRGHIFISNMVVYTGKQRSREHCLESGALCSNPILATQQVLPRPHLRRRGVISPPAYETWCGTVTQRNST